MIGHLILAIPAGPGIFFLGLAFVAMGTGFLKPNISSIVGALYGDDKGARRDAGFSIFYMSINLGSFFGQIFVPIIAAYNWHLGFGLAAIGMAAGLIWFKVTNKKHLAGIGDVPERKVKQDLQQTPIQGVLKWAIPLLLVAVLLLLQVTGQINITTTTGIAEAMKAVILLIVAFYFAYVIFTGNLNREEVRKILVIAVLFVGAAIFWSGFEQAGSALNLYARDFTMRNVFGWEMPAGVLQSVNPAFIIIFAPLMGALWVKLAAKNLNPRTPIKFAIGLVLLGLGFLVMVYAAKIATTGAKTGMFFLVVTYFLHSIGELTLSPVGLSAMTKLSPAKYVSQMMGIWFVAAALGNLIAGTFGGHFDPSNVQQMPDLFMTFVKLPVGAGLVMLALSPIFNRWMGDVK